MLSALLFSSLLASQVASADLWQLDAARTFTFSKSAPGEGGEVQQETTVQSLPSPFSVTSGHILRSDGTPVTVAEGLGDVGKEAELAGMVKTLRKEWARIAITQLLLTGVGFWVGGLGLVVVIPGLFIMWNAARSVDVRALQRIPLNALVGLIFGGVVTLIGSAFFIPGSLLGLYAFNRAIRAGKNAVVTSEDSVAAGTDWPVPTAAEVVRLHNERILKKLPRPDEKSPQDAPTFISL